MAMTKGKEGLASERWFNFKKDPTQLFQPFGTDWVVDAHPVKTRQGMIINPPCSLDESGECRLCSKFEKRKLLFWKGLDHTYRPLEPKILQLPKTGASRLYEVIEDTKVEPMSTVFKISRFGEGFKTAFVIEVEEEGVLPAVEVDDLESILTSWMDPTHLARVVPFYKDLTVVNEEGARGGSAAEAEDGSDFSIDDPDL